MRHMYPLFTIIVQKKMEKLNYFKREEIYKMIRILENFPAIIQLKNYCGRRN